MIENSEPSPPIAVPLTHGYYALIDAVDAGRVLAIKWNAKRIGNTVYARAHEPGSGKRGRDIFMHRLILGSASAGMQTDHRNGNGLDNCRTNLRACTHAENSRNQRCRTKAKTTSKFKGVYFDSSRNQYHVHIMPEKGRRVFIGRFRSEEDAARAYDAAARRFFGDFARCNFG